ncbi:MAG: transporter substrate-binding domain-containing protein [Oscillospiraceae bacterium]
MNHAKRQTIVFLVIALCLTLCSCSLEQSSKPYRVLRTLEGDNCYVVFRKGDRIGEWMIAAMKVLAANGTMTEYSKKWFDSDLTLMRGDKAALDAYDAEKEARKVVIGIDPEAVKLTEGSDGKYKGFDIDLAEAACTLLGWTIQYHEIHVADAKVELNAGEVDVVWCGFSDSSVKDTLQLSPAYLKNSYVVVTKTDSEITRFGQMEGATVAITKGSGEYAAVVDDLLASSKIKEDNILLCDSQEDCFDQLNSGKCDAIVVTQRLLQQHNQAD